MTRERWLEVMNNMDATLTPEEVAEGWHFCSCWDQLLVGPEMPEREFCTCKLGTDE